jgi:hypothetical protein
MGDGVEREKATYDKQQMTKLSVEFSTGITCTLVPQRVARWGRHG